MGQGKQRKNGAFEYPLSYGRLTLGHHAERDR
jgi:hypothetical protein